MFEDVLILKKGGIHIKKKNRGKFTEYCGGKVTEECIAKGKKSKDPKIRKRATFAANARKWKHEDGGVLKYQNPAIPLDLPEGSEYGGELEPAIVKPEPYLGELNTYYPVISEYPFTGHSELNLYDSDGRFVGQTTKHGTERDYNLVTNNCSDATRCAVEQVFDKKINPILFTTPGDVQDFVVEQTGSKPYWSDRGRTSVKFEIPFATAMDWKNKKIDLHIQNLLKHDEWFKKRMHEKAESRGETWDSSDYDESTRQIIEELESKKYKFQPFINKTGGILKAQEGTPKYGLPGGVPAFMIPQPLSPIDIAIKTAQAQTNPTMLPPGVKEVVGPDGKKVAIRTEQPLVPLEQSIAEWLPGTGDVAEVGYIADDVKNGNYGSAALGAGLIFLPGNAGKLLRGKRIANKLNSFIKKTSPEKISRYNEVQFINQMFTDPNRAVHVSPNSVYGATKTKKAAHSIGNKWLPGTADVSKVGEDNLVWLWKGSPYRHQWNDQTFISIPIKDDMIQTRQKGAIAVPEIDLTSNETVILTKNPIVGNFEKHIFIK